MKKRFMSLILVTLMVVSIFNTSAFAMENGTASDDASVALIANLLESGITIADVNDFTVEDALIASTAENELQPIDCSDLELSLDGEPMADLTEFTQGRSAASVTQQIVETLDTQGSAKYAIFSLSQNQVAQMTLRSPDNASLDYDLMLYKINSEGYTEGPISNSALSTCINSNGHTLDESIGYLRTETGSQQYAVFVYARVGGSSTEPFTLTISLDLASNLDKYEINDSPYYPVSVTMSGEGQITEANLNVVNDQDWFLWRNVDGFDKLSVSVTQGHQVEIYHVEGDSQMVLNPYTVKDGARVFDAAGLNYIRIFSEKSESNFSYADYTATLKPYRSAALASRISVTLDGDQGSNSYVTYYDTTLFRYKDVLTPTVKVTDSSGRAIEGVRVTMTLVSSFWSESSGNQVQTYTSSLTDAAGQAVFDVRPPATSGTFAVLLQGAITFRHHVDIDTLVFTVGSAKTTEQVYRLAYSEYVG